MSVTDSTTTSELVARAKAITERELAVYKERTKGSQAATERARKSRREIEAEAGLAKG